MRKQYKMMEWTDERIMKFWNYESQFPENYFAYQVGEAAVNRLHKYFLHAKNALDFGAGGGFMIPHLMSKGIEVSALDFSPDLIAVINNKFSGSKYFNGAFICEELISSGKKFDLIMVLEVIEHLNNSCLLNTMDNVKKLLSLRGVAIFTTPNAEDLSKNMVYCPESDCIFHRWQHVRIWSKDSLRNFLIECGFEIIDIITTDFSKPEKKWRILVEIKEFFKKILKKPAHQGKSPHLVAVVKKTGVY